MARGLNKVQLIGNVTRDPELKYTPSGSAVCTLSVATNRDWKDESGKKVEEVEFHRIVAWSKLAEICGQYLKKGSKVYIEGRLQTRKWQTKEGEDRYTTEIVANEMMMLDSKGSTSEYTEPQEEETQEAPKEAKIEVEESQDHSDDDIPF